MLKTKHIWQADFAPPNAVDKSIPWYLAAQNAQNTTHAHDKIKPRY
jgi:hypothetical protein